MRKHDRKPGTKTLFILVTYGILLYMALQHFSVLRSIFSWLLAILEPVIYGVCIAFVINLLMNLFRQKVFIGLARSKKKWVQKLCPVLCGITTAALGASILALIIFLMIPQITSAVNTLIEKMPSSSEQLISMIDNRLAAMNAPAYFSEKLHEFDMDWDSFVTFLGNLLDGKVETVLGTAFNATRSMLSAATNLILGFIIAIYILANKKRVIYVFHKIVQLIVPDPYEPQVFRVLHMTKTAFANFLTGQFVEAIIIGTLCTAGLALFRFPYAVTIGIMTGFTALLPIIGAWIGGGIGLLLVWVDAPEKAIWFIIFILALQQIEGQFIYPKVVGDSIGLPGLLVLIAVILGGGFGGILGIIVAVPLFAIGYALLKDAIDNMPATEDNPEVSCTETETIKQTQDVPMQEPDAGTKTHE